MGSSLTGMIYIFDEPSTGMHPRDVHRMTRLLKSLRDKGNTVLAKELNKKGNNYYSKIYKKIEFYGILPDKVGV